MSNRYHNTDVDGYIKDTDTGAVLNINSQKLETYKKQKQVFETAKQTAERINKVECDLNDIKKMLKQLLER
jgi:hypothetical protein